MKKKRFVMPFLMLLSACGYTQYKNAGSGEAPGTAGTPVPTSPGSPGSPNPSPSGSPTATVTFTEVSQQILQPKCVGCHSGGNQPNLSSYAGFATNTAYVVPGNPSASALYDAVQSGAMPQGGPPLSADQVALIGNWISQGALNN